MLGKQLIQAAAGSAAAGAGLYVDDVFSTFLYDGTYGGTTNTITNGLDLSGEGGLVWMKGRSNAYDHALISSDNNFQGFLLSNSNSARLAASSSYITALNDGFRINYGGLYFNNGGQDFVSWSFRKAPGFFDVVAYTGNSSSAQTISHNLGSAPGVMIIKSTSTAENWIVYSKDLYESLTGNFRLLSLNTANDAGGNIGRLNSTQPTSSVFTVGLDANTDGDNYVAYLFASDEPVFGTNSDEAIIKCGIFNVPGSGTFDVNLGFEPQFILYKQTSGGMITPNWYMHDTMRGLAQTNFNPLYANTTTVESPATTEGLLTVNPLGFKSTSSAHNSGNYMYMAIRRPHKPPTAGTDVFAAATQTGKAGNQGAFRSGFVVDMAIRLSSINAASNRFLSSRMTAPKYVY